MSTSRRTLKALAALLPLGAFVSLSHWPPHPRSRSNSRRLRNAQRCDAAGRDPQRRIAGHRRTVGPAAQRSEFPEGLVGQLAARMGQRRLAQLAEWLAQLAQRLVQWRLAQLAEFLAQLVTLRRQWACPLAR